MNHQADANDETGTVWRQDDNGNTFIVESGLSHDAADRRVAELEAKGHKQHYWVERSVDRPLRQSADD